MVPSHRCCHFFAQLDLFVDWVGMYRMRLFDISLTHLLVSMQLFRKLHLPHPVHEVWRPVLLNVILRRALQCSN